MQATKRTKRQEQLVHFLEASATGSNYVSDQMEAINIMLTTTPAPVSMIQLSPAAQTPLDNTQLRVRLELSPVSKSCRSQIDRQPLRLDSQ